MKTFFMKNFLICNKRDGRIRYSYQRRRWIYTSAYSKPDEKAITWATSGGYIENTIAVRIGDKDFVLE